MYSRALERKLWSDMGRKSLGLSSVFTLFRASTSDLFHSEGKIEYLIDELKRSRTIAGRAAKMKH